MEKRIAIQEGMSELQTLKTAIHEIAHAKLHAIDPEAPAMEQTDRPDSRTREVQAESVAYAVCQHYGWTPPIIPLAMWPVGVPART